MITYDFYPVFDATGQSSEFIGGFDQPWSIALRGFRANTIPVCRFYPAKFNPSGGYGAQYSALTGTGYTLIARLMIRTATTTTQLASTGVLTWDSGASCFEGVFSLNTTEVRAAISGLAQGQSVQVLCVVILFDNSGQPTICGQITPLFWAPVPNDLPDPTSVTDTIFANLFEACVENTPTVAWTRSGNRMLAAASVFGEATLSDPLRIECLPTVPGGVTAVNSTKTKVVTVNALATHPQLLALRVRGKVEFCPYTGGSTKGTLNIGGEPDDATINLYYLDVSSPAQRVWLNAGDVPNTAAVDFRVTVTANPGATLTLGYDSQDGSFDAGGRAIVVEGVDPSPDALDGQFLEIALVDHQAIATRITDLADAPATLIGQGGKVLAVNAAGSAIELVDPYYILTGTAADATPTELLIGGAGGTRLTLPDNTAYAFRAIIKGRSAGADVGTTWTARDSNRNWIGIACSTDGAKAVAAVYGGQLYTSTDYGATWTARDSNRNWQAVASSADGTKLVAVVNGGRIYTSTDSGATWTARDSVRDWYSVASSSDGTKLVAVVAGGQVYTSTDSGATWTARDSSRDWYSVASSSDGTKLVAVVNGGRIYTSTDSGGTWTARDSVRAWSAAASSADGTKLVAVVAGGQIYTSTDSGATWTARDSNRDWQSVTSSSDGARLVAGVSIGLVYLSTDAGVTWTATGAPSKEWFGVASSADGSRLLGAALTGQIYTTVGGVATVQSVHFTGHINRGLGAASTALPDAVDRFPVGVPTWGFDLQADTTHGSLKPVVTGAAATNIDWTCRIEIL
ncbi:MAG: hypothetical protein EBS05_18340 [Proteobacteria bacterium]|nr:hypothetical protein [Pseudomonadota bacterium]